MYILTVGKARSWPAWQSKVGQLKEDVSPCMRSKLDRKAKEARRFNGVKALMQKGKKLCLDQGSDLEMLVVVRYKTTRRPSHSRYIYMGQGEMLESFRRGEVIQHDISLLKPHFTLSSLIPTIVPAVEVDTPSKTVVSSGSGSCRVQDHAMQSVWDTPTATSGMLLI